MPVKAGNSSRLVCCLLASPFILGPYAMAASLRSEVQNAAGNCQVPFSHMETGLRVRPLAIANEGAKAAFVTCSLESNARNASGNLSVVATFTNRNPTASTVHCTLVDSIVDGPPVKYYVRSLVIEGNTFNGIIWNERDLPDDVPTFSIFANLSCLVPGGVDFNYNGHTYVDETEQVP